MAHGYSAREIDVYINGMRVAVLKLSLTPEQYSFVIPKRIIGSDNEVKMDLISHGELYSPGDPHSDSGVRPVKLSAVFFNFSIKELKRK